MKEVKNVDEIRAAIMSEYIPYSVTNGKKALAAKYGLKLSVINEIVKGLPKRPAQIGLLDEMKEAIVVAYDEEHLPLKVLMERFSLPREVVKGVLKEAGIELRVRQPVPADVKAEAIRLYTTGKYTADEVAERLKLKPETLKTFLTKMKVTKPKVVIDQAMFERILSLYGRGYAVGAISKATGVSHYNIRKIINGEPL